MHGQHIRRGRQLRRVVLPYPIGTLGEDGQVVDLKVEREAYLTWNRLLHDAEVAESDPLPHDLRVARHGRERDDELIAVGLTIATGPPSFVIQSSIYPRARRTALSILKGSGCRVPELDVGDLELKGHEVLAGL